jgi:DNA polymerase V
MGVPYFQIKDTLEKAGTTTFSSHFALYRDISRRVFSVMREELDEIEQYSVDEAFFTVSDDPLTVAKKVKERVEQLVGIPVSVGVAATKTQAKYANEMAKKGAGVVVLPNDDFNALAPDIPLSEIWGVGGKSELKYKAHQIYSVQDLLRADQARIGRIFGVNGLRLQQELQGISVLALEEISSPHHSVMSSRSFRNETIALPVLEDAVAYHVRHAAADIRRAGQVAMAMRVSIRPSRHGDYVLRGGSKEAVFTVPTNDTIELVRTAYELLQDIYEPGVPYKKAGIVLLGLQPAGGEQTQLFQTETTPAATAELLSAIDKINTKSGKELVQVGSQLRTPDWQSRVDARSPAYTTRWSDIATVQAK